MTDEGAPDLRKSFASRRRLVNSAMTFAAGVVTLLALVPLVSVLYTLFELGGRHLNWSMLVGLPPSIYDEWSRLRVPAGFGNAPQGTFVMVGLAAIVSMPAGTLAAIYMSEFAPDSRLTLAARFAAKTLTGLPSVLAGVFAYVVVVKTTGTASAYAGGLALALLMLPTVILTAEEALRQVPIKVREAAIGLGATRTQAVWKVVLPAGRSGMTTGVLLAVARAAGETAPLLFTARFSERWMRGRLDQPTPSMAVFIKGNSESPDDNLVMLAWVASFVLVAIILALNLTARYIGRNRH